MTLPLNTPHIAEILLPVPLDRAYSYLIPEELSQVEVGSYVLVPFGKRKLIGVVWDLQSADKLDPKLLSKLKPIEAVFPHPALNPLTKTFLERVAEYCMAPIGSLLKMTLSGSDLDHKVEPIRSYQLNPQLSPLIKLSPKQKAILAFLPENKILTYPELKASADATLPILTKMVEKRILQLSTLYPWQEKPDHHAITSRTKLTDEQAAARDILFRQIEDKDYSCTVLDGVTGSGKTEVYFEAIAKVVSAGKQALILLPEIALSEAWLQRFKLHFGFEATQWHSDIGQKTRRQNWAYIGTGKARIIVGARSALFLPYHDLGLIIVDEEHDGSFKQEEGVIYQARDMAILRAYLSKIPIILASATPSLETQANIAEGKYQVAQLRERHGEQSLPEIRLIDLREEKPPSQMWIAPPLKEAIHNALAQNQQILLFLNRRGYAPLLICRCCGYRFQCPNCSASLIYHKHNHALKCHHCDFYAPYPKACPKCKHEGELALCGPGVERIYDEAKLLFPEANIALMTSDVLTSQTKLREVLSDIYARKTNIIIGTQLIAKGHHFPHLSLVGVIDADLSLNGGDLRAGEKTYQLMHQVAGRAGREKFKGQVLIQTHYPDHPLMQTLTQHKRDEFLAYELQMRQYGNMPPYGKLAALIIKGPDLKELREFCLNLAQHEPKSNAVQALGPSPAPLAYLRNQYRMRFLLKAPKTVKIQPFIHDWLSKVKKPSTITLQIDIDPYSFL